ncbi:argininosuccinate lyase [Sediminicurvatus halobius]|uniref:Argininosuccinate lyase n=1 Tax=Sediminicurvatus halobius TaxID=2182432 RepID=A0A2U2N2F9_9GAMM|nr:argininosuccinate lyase [Spiribacter halobius]PWG63411.1 argininosuccinate lyase [Spiribacter halobius]UEX78081.1 argininosuccinate lyase [Spiribacter halobius]
MTDRDSASGQLWTGRFTEATDAFVEAFTASEHYDRRLYREDIRGSQAHARMLNAVGVLSDADTRAIVEGLDAIAGEIERGEFPWDPGLEDVHMNIEARLTARIGEAGKRLHTARSRNDQIATDVRLWLRAATDEAIALLRRFQHGLVDLAEREADSIMPGFTHLQVAQPVTFGHHMLAWYEMLVRDEGRFRDARERLDVCPLGSAALAGTTFPVDRERTARELGFREPTRNSLDAVSDRDFAIEFASAAALTMTHLSRMAEELVLWTSPMFDFIDLPDRFCTGSSIMPQKKNPDVAELVRGKAARAHGALHTLLTLMKGQPLAYNRDNQEDKEPLFDAADALRDSLRAFADMVPALTVKRDNAREAARRGFATATDLADYLVRQGVAFRDAHEIVGRAVRHGVAHGRDLAEMSLEELRGFSEAIGEDVFQVLTLEGSVAARDHLGGTAPAQVRAQVAAARERLAGDSS